MRVADDNINEFKNLMQEEQPNVKKLAETKIFQSTFPQPKKMVVQEKPKSAPAFQKRNDGPISDFSKFAHKKQLQIKQTQQVIQKTIRQAMYSHLEAMKKCLEYQKKLSMQAAEEFRKIKTELHLLGIDDNQQIINFIKNPLEVIQVRSFEKKDFFKKTLRTFIKICKQIKKYIVVQGKILNTQRLLAAQYLKHGQQMVIPTSISKNIFLKIGNNFVPSYVFLHEGKFIDRQQMMHLSNSERNKIMEMVMLFLKEKNIVVDKFDLQRRIQSQAK